MKKSVDRAPSEAARSASEDGHVAGVTRRAVLAATAAAATVGVDAPASAQSADPKSDMEIFASLSAALTGVAEEKLAPTTDSVGMTEDYFTWVGVKKPAQFAALLQIARAASLEAAKDNGIIPQDKVDPLVRAIEAKDDTKFLARSIVLMWYLGSWYEPDDLKALTQTTPPRFVGHTVISPKAYTQGWLWRVAQAHPMGYSELQFGYWNRPPQPLSDFIEARQPHGKGT
jgi:hypothetical protein